LERTASVPIKAISRITRPKGSTSVTTLPLPLLEDHLGQRRPGFPAHRS
jgi:hypothetical protein